MKVLFTKIGEEQKEITKPEEVDLTKEESDEDDD